MDTSGIREAVLATIRRIAPEVDAAALKADKPLRKQIDLDSMDWLNVIVGLHEALHIDIPEADYGKLTTLDAIVDYLAGRGAAGNG